MATKTAIVAAFAYLEGAGLPLPKAYADPGGKDAAVAVWTDQLRHDSDHALGEAVRSLAGVARFWPSVGQVIAAAPVPARPRLAPPEEPRGAYEQAAPWARQVALAMWDPDPGLEDVALQASLDAMAAEVYPLHDTVFAALSEDERWFHWCARRDAAEEVA